MADPIRVAGLPELSVRERIERTKEREKRARRRLSGGAYVAIVLATAIAFVAQLSLKEPLAAFLEDRGLADSGWAGLGLYLLAIGLQAAGGTRLVRASQSAQSPRAHRRALLVAACALGLGTFLLFTAMDLWHAGSF